MVSGHITLLSLMGSQVKPTAAALITVAQTGGPCHLFAQAEPAPPEGLAGFFSRLFQTRDFPARWECGTWPADLGWLHITADLLIFAAYLAIPVVLCGFLLRKRELPFPTVFWLFGAFILACGLGHLVEACIFWWPAYRFSGLVKAVTAIVSWATVVALIYVMPKALALPGQALLTKRLQAEVAERRQAQTQLEDSYNELARFTSNVLDREQRVVELKQEVNEILAGQGRPPRYAESVETSCRE